MPPLFSASRLLAEVPRLRRYARILTDDPERADNLVEETLARARQMQDGSGGVSTQTMQLLALLRTVSSAKSPPTPRRTVASSAPRVDAHTAADARSEGKASSQTPRGAEMLEQCLRLPLEQREVLVLVAVERLSYTEISGLLGMPVATVIARLSQARETLRARSASSQSAPGAN